MLQRVLLVVCLLGLPGYIEAQSSWEFSYVKGQEVGDINSCQAGIYYKDGAFIARLFSEELDFFFSQNDLALPTDDRLGVVEFAFKDQKFVLVAFSGRSSDGDAKSVNYMFLRPKKTDYAEILALLRYSTEFSMYFPGGTGNTVGLRGSNHAILRAGECWAQKETGKFGKNPFQNSGDSAVNPFN